LLSASAFASPGDPSLAEMQWHRRVLIFSAADVQDPQYRAQQQALAEWTGADERVVSVVRIVGDVVSGSREPAAELRRRYQLPVTQFALVLIGKDGHVALRSSTALTGQQLAASIDAMPMRKAGQG